MYSDVFFPIPFHFLKSRLQPTKLVWLIMGSVPTTWETPTVGLRVLSICSSICLDYSFLFVYSFWSQLKDHFLKETFLDLPCSHNHHHHHQTRTESPVTCFIPSYTVHHCTYRSSHRWFVSPYPDCNLKEITTNVC